MKPFSIPGKRIEDTPDEHDRRVAFAAMMHAAGMIDCWNRGGCKDACVQAVCADRIREEANKLGASNEPTKD